MFKSARSSGFEALVCTLVVAFTLTLGASLVQASGTHAPAAPAGYSWVDTDGHVHALELPSDDDDAAAFLD
jgi:hypothetical protein